jgi:hypothetical protein
MCNPDCLVFKLEEVERETLLIDTTLYIIYDKMNHKFLLRGRRRWTPQTQSCTYSFECEFASELVDFIQYIICPRNKLNETLFNYDNLSEDPNEITFEFLHDHDHSDYELAGYDWRKFNRKRMVRNLRMLRNIFNHY